MHGCMQYRYCLTCMDACVFMHGCIPSQTQRTFSRVGLTRASGARPYAVAGRTRGRRRHPAESQLANMRAWSRIYDASDELEFEDTGTLPMMGFPVP